MRLTYTADLWWKNAVVYCLDVETYKDGNGDGIGDFRGLTQQVDHLDRLGVTCIWLMPFFPSPSRDDGYDIDDFYSVDPRLGTLGDFVEFMRTARDRGMRVIADLVVNHTSDEHPWFKEARSSRDSPKRDWYIWQDKPDPSIPRPSSSPTRRTASGSSTRRPASTTTQLLQVPARPEHGQSGGPRRDRARSSASGWSSGCPGSGWTPCRS